MSRLGVLERDSLTRVIDRLTQRVNQLEAILQGQPVGTARIADAAITNAKIDTLSAEKITTGTLKAETSITIFDSVNDKDVILIGFQEGGFG